LLRFKIDENLPTELVELFENAGYSADTVFSENISGADDNEISAICIKENLILITLDTDFADIRTYPPEEHPGIIVMRLANQGKKYVKQVVERFIPILKDEPINNKLWIVDETRIRIREEL